MVTPLYYFTFYKVQEFLQCVDGPHLSNRHRESAISSIFQVPFRFVLCKDFEYGAVHEMAVLG